MYLDEASANAASGIARIEAGHPGHRKIIAAKSARSCDVPSRKCASKILSVKEQVFRHHAAQRVIDKPHNHISELTDLPEPELRH